MDSYYWICSCQWLQSLFSLISITHWFQLPLMSLTKSSYVSRSVCVLSNLFYEIYYKIYKYIKYITKFKFCKRMYIYMLWGTIQQILYYFIAIAVCHSLILIDSSQNVLPLHIYLNHSLVRLKDLLAQLIASSVREWKCTAVKMNNF